MNTQRTLTMIVAILFFATACGSRSVGSNDNLNNNTNQIQQGLLITMHESSPSNEIPQWNQDVLIAVYAFTAVGDKNIGVDSLVLTRIGAEDWPDFDGIKLMIDGRAISGWGHFDDETNQETFPDAFTVLAGETVLLEVHAWMDAEPERTNRVCIQQPGHIDARYSNSGEEVQIVGDFPVCSHELTTYALPVGTVRYTVIDRGRIALLPGEHDVLALSVILEGEDRDSIMYYMDFYETAQEVFEAYSNPRVYLNGVLHEPSHEIRIDGNWIGFIFENNPIVVTTDATVLMELVLDYNSDIPACTRFNFDLGDEYPFYARDAEYPVQANVEETPESITPYPDYITGDQVAAALDPDNPPAGDVQADTNDHEFLAWAFSCQGSGPVWWFDLDVVLGSGATINDLDNFKIWRWLEGSGTWYQYQLVHDPLEAVCNGNRCTLTLEAPGTSVVEFAGCQNTRYKITMDILPSATPGSTFHVELDTSTILAEIFPYTNTVDFTSGVLVGNEMTVVP